MDCFDDHFEAKKAPIPWFVFLMLYNTTVEEMGNDTRPDWNELQKKGKYRCGATLLNRRVHVGFDN